MLWRILICSSVLSSLVLGWLVYDSRQVDYLTKADFNRFMISNLSVVSNYCSQIVRTQSLQTPSNDVGVAGHSIAPSNPSDDPTPKKQVLRGDYKFHQCGTLKWVDFEGDDFRVGAPSEYGRVILVDEFYTICLDDDGNQTILRGGLSEYEREIRRRSAPPRVSLQAGRARTGGGKTSL